METSASAANSLVTSTGSSDDNRAMCNDALNHSFIAGTRDASMSAPCPMNGPADIFVAWWSLSKIEQRPRPTAEHGKNVPANRWIADFLNRTSELRSHA